jgi:hypothetical protein
MLLGDGSIPQGGKFTLDYGHCPQVLQLKISAPRIDGTGSNTLTDAFSLIQSLLKDLRLDMRLTRKSVPMAADVPVFHAALVSQPLLGAMGLQSFIFNTTGVGSFSTPEFFVNMIIADAQINTEFDATIRLSNNSPLIDLLGANLDVEVYGMSSQQVKPGDENANVYRFLYSELRNQTDYEIKKEAYDAMVIGRNFARLYVNYPGKQEEMTPANFALMQGLVDTDIATVLGTVTDGAVSFPYSPSYGMVNVPYGLIRKGDSNPGDVRIVEQTPFVAPVELMTAKQNFVTA